VGQPRRRYTRLSENVLLKNLLCYTKNNCGWGGHLTCGIASKFSCKICASLNDVQKQILWQTSLAMSLICLSVEFYYYLFPFSFSFFFFFFKVELRVARNCRVLQYCLSFVIASKFSIPFFLNAVKYFQRF